MDVTKLTKRLVEVPSHQAPEMGIDAETVGDVIESWLSEHTDAVVERDDAPDGGNVIARRGEPNETGAGATTLGLVGHHDVVPPADSQVTTEGDYVVEERDGRLYGRGTCDMKGPLAAAMIAFATADVPADHQLVFASFVGEERGGVGAQWAIDHGFDLDRAVVTEGSTGYSAPAVIDVAIAHKGRRGSTVTARGEAAHASEVGQGVNAIYRATEAIDLIRNFDVPTTEVLGHPVAGSIAVTEIEGGSAWNVIPDRCTVTVDERTVPGERAPLEKVAALPGVEYDVEQDLPPMACEDEAFADQVLEIATDVQADDGRAAPAHVVKPHATDAGWLSDGVGTDCVIVGAAESGEAHTADESVSIDAIESSVDIYRRVLETA